MPSDGVSLTSKDNLLTTDEILYLASLFVRQGVTKIRLTGGEPTVRKDVADIIGKVGCGFCVATRIKLRKLTSLMFLLHMCIILVVFQREAERTECLQTIAMTTNGLTLTRQLVKLQKAGLNLLNISLDTLRADRYEKVTRRKGWERVIAGIDLAIQLGFDPVKVSYPTSSYTLAIPGP